MEDRVITAFPLCWPDSWKRTPRHRRQGAKFGKAETVHYGTGPVAGSYRRKKPLTILDGVQRILDSLRRMGVPSVIISTNVPTNRDGTPNSRSRKPEDPGVAIYWRKNSTKPMQSMAVDLYDEVADNLAAIAATLDAMRAIERHGGAEILERAFRGFAALPETATITEPPWRFVLKLPNGDVTAEQVNAAFKQLAVIHHPDRGGDAEQFKMISRARSSALEELKVAQ